MALRSDASTTTTTRTSTTLLWSRDSSGGRRIVHLVVVALVCMIGVTSISLLLSKSMKDFTTITNEEEAHQQTSLLSHDQFNHNNKQTSKSYYSSHSKKYPQHGSSSRGFDRDLNQKQNVKLSATIKRSSLTFTHDQMEEMRFKRYFKNHPKRIRAVQYNDLHSTTSSITSIHHGRNLQSSEAKEPFVTSASFTANGTTNESSLVELSPSAGVPSNKNVSISAATGAATTITTGTSPSETLVVNTTSTLNNNKNNTNQDVPAGNGATSSTSTTTTDIHKNRTNTTSSPSSTNSKINTTTTKNDENETTTTTVAALGGAPPTNEEQKQQQINKQPQQNTEDESFHWWVKVKPNNSCSQPPPPTRRSHSATVAKYFLTQPSSSSTAAATPTRLSPVPPRNQILDDVSSNSTTTVENKDNVDDDVTQEQSPDGKKNDRRRRANRSLVVGMNETNNNDATSDGGGGISQHEQQVAKNDKARAVARSICLEYPDYHNVQEYMILSGGFTDDDWTTFPVYAFDLTSTHHLQSQEKSCDASASSLWEDEARKSMDESDRHLPIPSGRWYYLGNGGQDTSSSRRRTRSKHNTSRNLRAGDTSIMTDPAHTTSDSTTNKRISTTARRETLEDEGSSTTTQEEMMAVVVEEEDKDGSHIEDEDIDLSSSSTTTRTTNDTNNQTETSTTTAQPTTTSTTSTTWPMGRVGHVSVVSPTTHELFVFGGLTYGHRTFHVADQETSSSSFDENDGEPTTTSSSLPPVKLWKAKLPPSKDVWGNEADTSSENEGGDAADSSFSHSPSLSLEWEEVTPRVAARFVEEQTLIARGEAAGGLWIHPHTKEEYMIFYGGLRKSSSSYSSSTTSTSWSSSSYGTGLDMPLGDVWAYSLQNNLLEQWASYPPVLEQQASYNYYPRNKNNNNEEQTTDEGDNKSNQSPSTLLPPDPLLSDYDAIYNDEYYFGNDYPSMMGGGAGISYPIARTAHAATVTSNKLITYGGMALSTMTGATTESGIGGIGGSSSSSSWVPPSWQMLDDIWEFDLLKRQWIGKRQMYPPLARSYHSIGGMGGTLVSTGGFRASDTFAGEQVAFVFADTLISLDPSAATIEDSPNRANHNDPLDETAGDDPSSVTNEQEMEQQQHHHHEGKFDDYENGLMLNELIRESVVEFWQKAVSPTTKEADGIPHRLEHSSVIDSYGSLYVWGGRFRYVNQITSDIYRLDILNPGTLSSSVGSSTPSPGSPLWSPLAARDVWKGRGQIRSEISTEIAEPDGMDEYEAELQTLHLIVAIMIFMSVLFTTMLGSLRRQVDEANQNAVAAANGGAFATLDGARFGMMDFMATNGGGIGIGSSNSNLNRRGGVRQDVIDTFPIKLFQPEPVASSTMDHVEMTCVTTSNTRTNHNTTNNNDDESVQPVNSSIDNNNNEETEAVSSTQTQVVSSSIEEMAVAPSNNNSNIPPPEAFTTTTVTDPTATATTTTALSSGAQEEGTTTSVLPPPPSSCLVDTTSSENYLFSEDDYELPACVICLVEYEMGDEMRILPCQHEFHKDCVDAWLYNHSSCPACRHSLAHTATAPTAAAAAQQEDADSSPTSSSQLYYDDSPTAGVGDTIMPNTESTTTTTHRTIVPDHDDDDIDNDPASRQVRPRLLTQLWNRTRANVTSYPGRQQQRRRRQGRSIYGGVFRLSDNVIPPSAVEDDDPNDNNHNNTSQNDNNNGTTAITGGRGRHEHATTNHNTSTVVVEDIDDTLHQVEMINYRVGSSGGTASRTAVPSSDAFIL